MLSSKVVAIATASRIQKLSDLSSCRVAVVEGAQVNRENLAAVERLSGQLPVTSEWLDGLRNLAGERSIIPLDSRALAGLQHQADELRELRLIPKRVRVADGTYSLIMRQNWTT